jgi:hypothetical protein
MEEHMENVWAIVWLWKNPQLYDKKKKGKVDTIFLWEIKCQMFCDVLCLFHFFCGNPVGS